MYLVSTAHAFMGEDAKVVYRLGEDCVTIGRNQDACDIYLNKDEVSRKHAIIFQKGGLFFLEDCGSTNGTHINNTLLTSLRTLLPGDVIDLVQSRAGLQCVKH